MRLLLLLCVVPLWAADDASAILKRLIEAEKSNSDRAGRYTYVEDCDRYSYKSDGRLRKISSETHEIIFVEGLEYKKLAARDGKPLSAREQKRVENEMRETAAERRKRRPPAAPGGYWSAGNQRADLGSDAELLTLFENRVVGEEEVRGRKAWVIESVPTAAHVPANEHQKAVLSLRKRLWIDQADGLVSRRVYTVIADGIFIKPGSTLTVELDKVDAETWQPTSLVIDAYNRKGAVLKPWARTEYRMSRFQKFDVQSTITIADPR